jgi:uncharacterized protein YqjF (DUF2071 family)
MYVMQQTWQNLTFMHWRYDVEEVRKTIPAELTLDTFDGSAWIGLVPFVLAGVRPFGLPATPWISTFPETNVRTYVRGPDGERGVWFHTLEADRLIAVMAARTWFKLPYRWAAMDVRTGDKTVEYRSERKASFGQGKTDVAIEVGERIETDELADFLTSRYRLYTFHNGRVGCGKIVHEPWPLQHGKVLRLNEDLIVNCGLSAPVGEPVVHFCREQVVDVEPLRWLERTYNAGS